MIKYLDTKVIQYRKPFMFDDYIPLMYPLKVKRMFAIFHFNTYSRGETKDPYIK